MFVGSSSSVPYCLSDPNNCCGESGDSAGLEPTAVIQQHVLLVLGCSFNPLNPFMPGDLLYKFHLDIY